MQFTPLQPIDNTEPFVSGDVKIEPNVAIASGVILQAAADCQIVIATGVCIGMGVILHAYQGNIKVESGVTIGAGVLVVGKSKIGANACIGSVATIIEHDVEPNQVVPPTSIIGESGRQILENSTTAPSQPPSQTVLTPHITTTTKSNDDLSVDPELSSSSELSEENLSQTSTFNYPDNHQELGSSSELDEENIAQTSTFNYPDNHQELGSSSELDEENIAQKSTFKYPGNHQGLNSNYQFFKKTEPENDNSNALVNQELTNNSSSPDQEKAKNEEETQNKIEQAKTQLQEEAPETTKTPIYGQDYVNRMMKTLFPHKNSLSSPPDEED
ncbi:hypothetical protein [Okeania hirsuta]|uniref:hypothetical protein n=1 Tax=Okeania hirsuta TaxID=1458930 RepID=UPI000F549705|nr:hypothetical protein [Okeania hirsuta]RQH04031.1 hypothetical protein D4Z78_31600 [Okeania hirsuta]RQH13408.1 hypothetical protein D4Z78_23975 [Okeania hirsuta]